MFFKVAPFSRRFSGPKDLQRHIRKPNSKVTTQKLSNQHTPTLSARTPGRRSGIRSKGRPAETIRGLMAVSAPNVLERDAVVLFLCGCRKAVGDKCQVGVLLGGAAELLPARFIFNACLPWTIDGLKSGSLRRRGEEWVFFAFVCGAPF